jgi:sugar-specific transcriptional regulator TrmB
MQITNLARKLELSGLSEKQAKVYVAALFLGPAAVQRIAEQADVNRATTYVILAELADMGLVSETSEGKKTVFVAEPPEAIERYLNSLEKDIETRKTQLKDTMKELKDVSRVEVADAPVVRFFKGPEAAESVTAYSRRKSKRNDVVYGISDIDEVLKFMPNVLSENPKMRIKKNISSKVIYSGTIDVADDIKSGRETKKINQKVQGDVNIYPGIMTILSYNGEESTGVIIESKEIVAVMRQLFELAWDNQEKK